MKRRYLPVRPRGSAWGWLMLGGAMWYAGASQGNGAAYALCFLLVSTSAISLVHGALNLHGLKLIPGTSRPAFAGREQHLPITVWNTTRRARGQLEFYGPGGVATLDVVEAGASPQVELPLATGRRGVHTLETVEIRSSYPLGIFEWRIVLPMRATHLVYPALAGNQPLPVAAARAQASSSQRVPSRAGDDFAGLRGYMTGESQRHIDWKAVARGQPLMTKQFSGAGTGTLMLRWAEVPARESEVRLSQLAKWVMEAEKAGLHFGLELPRETIAPDRGARHVHRCLSKLASWEGGVA